MDNRRRLRVVVADAAVADAVVVEEAGARDQDLARTVTVPTRRVTDLKYV